MILKNPKIPGVSRKRDQRKTKMTIKNKPGYVSAGV